MPWTDEVVEQLKKLWVEGLTTSEIAKQLGVSKNSIVGKVHRLGLSGRPSPIKRKDDTPPVNKTTQKKQAEKPETKKSESVKVEASVKPVLVTKEKIEKKNSHSEASSIKDVKVEKELAKETKNSCPSCDCKKNTQIHTPAKNNNGFVQLVDLDAHTCRWPIGDPKDEKFHFCGKKVRIGQTYCEEHSEIAYVKTTKR